MDNNLVVMHTDIYGDILTSAHSLSINEQRLIYCVLKQMPKDEPIDPNTSFFVSREDFIELGANTDNVVSDIHQATKDLMERTLCISTSIGVLEFHWLSRVLRYDKNAEQKLKEKYPNPNDYAKYIDFLKRCNLLKSLPSHRTDDVIVKIVFNESFIPLLGDLKASFTQSLIKDIGGFRAKL